MKAPGITRGNRQGAAAAEFAICLPLLFTLLYGLWEVGRVAEVEQVMWNSARESARDASLGQDTLSTCASNLLTYLQAAEPTAFPSGHTTVMQTPNWTIPANSTGLQCWDQTANKELFTITFSDLTNTSVTDPTGMSQLDRYQIGVSVPYATIGFTNVAYITGTQRLYATVTWASMQDSPFTIVPALPAQ